MDHSKDASYTNLLSYGWRVINLLPYKIKKRFNTRMRFHNKKGMEMWQIVFIILALFLFFFVLFFYGDLKGTIEGLMKELNFLL